MENLKNVVVGYDGSPLSELAVRRALLACRTSTFALVHVVMVARQDEGKYLLPTGERLDRYSALEMLRLTLKQLVQGWRLSAPHVRLVAHLRTGPVARTLVDVSYRFRADLVVLGAHGAESPSGRVGHVTHEVLEWTSDLKVHVEASPFVRSGTRDFDGVNWAYVFGRTPLGSSQPAPRGEPS